MRSERGGLKAAFMKYNNAVEANQEAELKLLGRSVTAEDDQKTVTAPPPSSHQAATIGKGGLVPRPLLQREPVRQLSFRCPRPIAADLRRKAAYNQLEQQAIIIEGLERVLSELPDPPAGWEP